MKDHQDLKKDFHRAAKIHKPACKVLSDWTKKKKLLNIFKQILCFFDQNLY